MNLANKTFKDNNTGEVLKVIDSFEHIAILENKSKIDTRRLLDTNLYTEQIDPTSFLNSNGAYNSIFENIKNIQTDNIPFDDNVNTGAVVKMDDSYIPPMQDDSAVVYTSVDDEKAELARKYGASIDNTSTLVSQNEAFSKILGEDGVDELPYVPQRPIQVDEPIQRVEVSRDNSGEVTGSVIINNQESIPYEKQYVAPVEDPIHTVFRGIKRSVPFNIDLNLENKIPKLEFIEMMEDSYEKSIIDFLANDITQSILNNPDFLREKIKEKINEMVYKPKKAVVKKKPVFKSTVKSTPKKQATPRVKPSTDTLNNDLKTITAKKTKTKKETEQQ